MADAAENNSLPEGYKDIPKEDRDKAKVFFDRAKTVADTGNYEYSVEMYIQGLTLDTDSIEAHQALRDVSLKRKAGGGKPMSMGDKWKLKKGDDKQNALNAEKMLAYDPGNMDHMVQLLQAAQKAGFYDTVMWIGPILFRANLELPQKKQEYSKFITLKDTYRAIQEYKAAIEALAAAMRLKPDNMDLGSELKDLGARATIKGGKYESGGSFRDSVRDADAQRRLMVQDMDIRNVDMLSQAIAEAEAAYAAEPNDPSKLARLVDMLKKTDQMEYENRAIEVLDQKYRETKQYRFKQQVGQIQIAQLGRMERSLKEQILRSPNDADLAKQYKSFLRDRAEQELAFYSETVENYPTDSQARFEMARRTFMLGRFEDAISLFQQARNDPKYRTQATVLLGRAFFEAQFLDEAVDTFQAVITEYPIKGDEKSIDMHYWFAVSLEKKGELPTALKNFSQVAQWNFNYRDVQARIKRLRGQQTPQTQASAPGAATT